MLLLFFVQNPYPPVHNVQSMVFVLLGLKRVFTFFLLVCNTGAKADGQITNHVAFSVRAGIRVFLPITAEERERRKKEKEEMERKMKEELERKKKEEELRKAKEKEEKERMVKEEKERKEKEEKERKEKVEKEKAAKAKQEKEETAKKEKTAGVYIHAHNHFL